VCAQELEDAEHDVVDVAEARRLALFGVMQPAGPVDGNIGGTTGDALRCGDGATGRYGAELENALEWRIVREFADEDCDYVRAGKEILVADSQSMPPWVNSSEVSGVTRVKKFTYSSVWNAVIFSGVARFAR
jgi:hypothetical protein